MLHFIDPDQFHTFDVFNKFGSIENFRDALKKCEINTEAGEKQLMEERVWSMQAIKTETVDENAQLAATKMIVSDESDDDISKMKMGAPGDLTATFAAGTIQAVSKTESNDDKVKSILQVIKPYILRRDASVVEKAQPQKNEYIVSANLTPMQQQYSKFILELNQSVLKYTTSEPQKLQNIITQLKKVCNHPYMFKDAVIEKMSLDEIIENSGKMQVLDALLTKFKAEGHKVLIYTQMLRTMQILA